MNSSAVEQQPTSATPASVLASGANSSVAKNEDAEYSRPSNNNNAPVREVWKNKLDFLMSMIVFAVGLGNVWRFPFLAFKHGGGSFLCAYAIYVSVIAVPMFMMEASLGQYTGMGALEMWNIYPILKGVGYANLCLTFNSVWYYHILIIWALFYFLNSFVGTFPWETCNNSWNNINENLTCVLTQSEKQISSTVLPFLNSANETTLAHNSTFMENDTFTTIASTVGIVSGSAVSYETAGKQFFQNRVLELSFDFFDFNQIRWELFGLMLALWLVIYFCLWRGATNARWYIWFSATFPYFLLFTILARALTLKGAMLGVQAYLTPKWDHLLDPLLWRDVGSQVFFSYSIGLGTISALGAYNEFNSNVLRDSIATCFVNGMTSIVAGFAVFSILGHMATVLGVSVEDVAAGGPGLTFITFPEAVSQIPLKQFWAAGFFIMLLVLGLGTEVCLFEGIYTSFEDSFPVLRTYKKLGIGLMCVFIMTISLPMLTSSGMYWLQLIDGYGVNGYSVLFITFFELVGITWGYGADRLRYGVEEMIGIELGFYWIFMWKYAGPVLICSTFLANVVLYTPVKDSLQLDITVYPIINVFALLLSVSSMLLIPGYALYYLFTKQSDQTMEERLHEGTHAPLDLNKERVEKFSLLKDKKPAPVTNE